MKNINKDTLGSGTSEKKEKAYNYQIHAFMSRELGLKNSEEKVYALIYSFTKSKSGYYHGSVGGIARLCGVSRDTVIRALRALVARGLIIKTKKEGSSVFTYVATALGSSNLPHSSDSCDAEGNDAFCDTGCGILQQDNNSNNNSVHTSSSSSKAHARELFAREILSPPRQKYYLKDLEAFPSIIISEDQYDTLVELYGYEITETYLCRLNKWIMGDGYEGKMIPGHYRILRKWIEYDLSLS